jgi:dienelactone hydrolase
MRPRDARLFGTCRSPNCLGAQPWGNATPMLLLLGALDDVTPPQHCASIIRGSTLGQIKAVVYPKARHGFDLRGLPESMPYTHGGGTLGYNAEADQASKIEIAEFLKK